MYLDTDENLFYNILVLTVEDYFSSHYAKKHVVDHLFISKWFRGYVRLEVEGLAKEYTFVEYCGELLGISPLNAEEIRKMIVQYKYSNEAGREKVVRDSFGRLEENHEHNDPDPWWTIPADARAREMIREAGAKVGRSKHGRSTYPVFS